MIEVMDIDTTRWYMQHFDADPIEQKSVRFTVEVFKTLAVIALAAVIIPIV